MLLWGRWLEKFISLFTWLLNTFLIQLILVDWEVLWLWSSCRSEAQVERKISTLPWFPESVNSWSSSFILGPLAFPCSWLLPLSVVGKFIPCWNQLGFKFSFPLLFPSDFLWTLDFKYDFFFFFGGYLKVFINRRIKSSNFNS